MLSYLVQNSLNRSKLRSAGLQMPQNNVQIC